MGAGHPRLAPALIDKKFEINIKIFAFLYCQFKTFSYLCSIKLKQKSQLDKTGDKKNENNESH